MRYYDNVVELVGNTPLVRLRSVTAGIAATVLAKVEYFNPGGSVKDPGGDADAGLDRPAAAAGNPEPLLDPAPYLPVVPVPVVLAHGREDRLVPWTELPRLRRALPDARVRHAVVTKLFAHSFRERRFPTPTLAVEAVLFLRSIHPMVHLV